MAARHRGNCGWKGKVLRRVAAAALLSMLAACATGPQVPLLSPLNVAKRYGYAEAMLGPAKVQVTYVGPSRQSSAYASERDPDINAARTQAYDLAVWRAAQIAVERGFAGFHIDQTRTDIDTTYDDPFYDPFYGPYGPYIGPPFHRRIWGYPGYPPYDPYAYIQARVTIDVTLLQALGSGDYAAQDVIAQLRRTYPTAEGVAANVGAPSAVPPSPPPAPSPLPAPAPPPSS